jgi:hypothetical protein
LMSAVIVNEPLKIVLQFEVYIVSLHSLGWWDYNL